MSEQEPGADFIEVLGRVLFPDATSLTPGLWARIAGTYDFTAGLHGASPKAALWRRGWGQRRRFKRLLQVLDHDRARSDVSINDFGCGYGALFDAVKGERPFRSGRYVGCDISPTMIALARERIDDPRAVFIETSALPEQADYTLASGTFGLRLDADEEQWTAWVCDALMQMAEASRKGFAFNLLHAGCKTQAPTLYYAWPERFTAYLRERFPGIEPRLIFERGDVDFTVLMRF